MKTRRLALLGAALAVLGAVWLVRAEMRGAVPASNTVISPPGIEPLPAETLAEAGAPSARTGRLAVEPKEAAAGPDGRSSDEGDVVDPPTPAHPGPGQALLWVEVVALETGRALAGARLGMGPTSDDEEHEWITSTQPDSSRGVENDDVITDAAGRGEFVLQAHFAYTLWGGGENGLADEVELPLEPFREGERRDVRLALPTEWTFDWYGQVIDGESELPVAGAEVEVLATYSAETLDELHVLARGTTGAGGRIGLRLPAWEHMCACARAPGYSRAGERVKAEQRSFETAGVVRLFRSASLDARIVAADGRPAAGVEVRLHTGAWEVVHEVGSVADLEWRARSDPEGQCVFAELPARVGLSLDLLRGEGALQRLEDLRLEPGESRRVEWRLQSGCRLAGLIRDHEGHPLAVPLSLVQIERPLWMHRLRDGDLVSLQTWDAGRRTFASLRSDSGGRFSIEGVGAGSWGIGTPEDTDELPAVWLALEITPGELVREVELQLPRALSIQGVVLDPEGNPTRMVHVSCRGKDAPHEQFTNADWSARDGSFALGPLLAGEYSVVARANEPLQADSEPALVRAGARDVTLRLRWGGTLGGSVVDGESGAPVAARVTYGGRPIWRPGEEFEVERLLPGTYDLVARTEDGRIGVRSAVTVRARERNDEIVLPVRRGARLTLRTRAPEGTIFRIEVEWQGILVESCWGDPEGLAVPPGALAVRWLRIDREGQQEIEHEESRTLASADEELVIEHRIP